MTDSTSDDGRDDFILQERLAGRSARSISKELRCTVGEVDASLDRTLPKIDNAMRLRHVSLDLQRLDELLKVFFARAIEKADTQAGLVCVKILERKATLLGLDQPLKLDVISVQAEQEPSSFDRITMRSCGLPARVGSWVIQSCRRMTTTVLSGSCPILMAKSQGIDVSSLIVIEHSFAGKL